MRSRENQPIIREAGIYRRALAIVLCVLCATPATWGQQQSIAAEKPSGFVLVRPFSAAYVPPTRGTNSPRLRDLVRGGKIYLTAQDAIALALENNIDLEIDRYNPLIGDWALERAQGGGALPGVPSGTTLSNRVASGQGAAGSLSASGVNSGGNNSNSSNNGAATLRRSDRRRPSSIRLFRARSPGVIFPHRSQILASLEPRTGFKANTITVIVSARDCIPEEPLLSLSMIHT